jgi:hypothetical protein
MVQLIDAYGVEDPNNTTTPCYERCYERNTNTTELVWPTGLSLVRWWCMKQLREAIYFRMAPPTSSCMLLVPVVLSIQSA